MNSTIYSGLNSYVNPPVYNGPLVYNGVDDYESGGANFVLLRLAQSVVSMICIDGTDGKSNAYQLTPVFDDGLNHAAACTWSSSNPAAAVVSGSGIVSGVLGGSGQVTISCTYEGVTAAALVTIYPTFPDAAVLYAAPGGNYTGTTNFTFVGSDLSALGPLIGSRFRGKINTAASNTLYALYNDSESVYLDTYGGNIDRYNQTNSGGVATAAGYAVNAISGSPVDADLIVYGPLSSVVRVNGANYSGAYQVTYTGPTNDGFIYLAFMGGTGEKNINLSFGTEDKNPANLADRTQCPLFYVPQNFVKYTDAGALVNYTEILNFGTAAGFNLSSNNTPAGWY